MRILVTGASGLLGLNVACEAGKDHKVYGTVHRNLIETDAFSVIQVDLLAPGAVESLLEQTKPDWIIHCAALAKLDACEANPQLAGQLNTELPKKLAGYVARGGARLIYVSTDSVFDGRSGKYTEEDEPNPLSVYACTKLDGERAVAEANPDAIIARVNLYGWSLSGKRSLAEFFYYNLVAGKSIQGFTDVFFCPLLANDLARIFFEMLERDLNGLFHVVGSECTSKYQFGMALANKFGLDGNLIKPVSVNEAGLRATRSPRLTLKNEKLSRAIKTRPPRISTGLERFYTLYQQGYPQAIREMDKLS